MSGFEELTDHFTSRITDVARSREYARYRAIMEDLEATESAIEILGRLYGRLPGSTIANFLLVNLHFVGRWTIRDYQVLLALVCDNEIAMYHLDHFLMREGGLDYDTRAELWAGRYKNLSRHYHAITFGRGEVVPHTDDFSLLAKSHEKYFGVRAEDLRAFQCDLHRKVTSARAS